MDFVGRLEKDDGAKNNSKHFLRFINCHRIILVMEHQKVLSLLNEANDSKFVTRKRNIVSDNSKSLVKSVCQLW